jgi:hypothetical protein
MTEQSVLAAPRRRFSRFIRAALEGLLALGGRSTADVSYRFPPF